MEAEVRPDEQAAVPPTAATQSPSTDTIFQGLSIYPFSTDPDFQTGLASILGPSDETQDDEKRQDTILQAQCFYFARKYNLPPLDPALYQSWLRSHSPAISNEPTTVPHPNQAVPPLEPTPQRQTQLNAPEPPYPTSFAHIVDLITNNKPIPGIEDIPDTILAAGSSQPNKTPRRRKPWEKDTDETDDADTAGGDVVRLLQPLTTSEMPAEPEANVEVDKDAAFTAQT